MSLGNLDLRGLNPAPVTPFTVDGDVDYAALADLGKFLASVDGVKSLVVLGHAGEGTFLTQDEQVKVIETLVTRSATRSRSSPASPVRAPRSPSRRPSGPSPPAPRPP